MSILSVKLRKIPVLHINLPHSKNCLPTFLNFGMAPLAYAHVHYLFEKKCLCPNFTTPHAMFSCKIVFGTFWQLCKSKTVK
jgi:hypothetical protein